MFRFNVYYYWRGEEHRIRCYGTEDACFVKLVDIAALAGVPPHRYYRKVCTDIFGGDTPQHPDRPMNTVYFDISSMDLIYQRKERLRFLGSLLFKLDKNSKLHKNSFDVIVLSHQSEVCAGTVPECVQRLQTWNRILDTKQFTIPINIDEQQPVYYYCTQYKTQRSVDYPLTKYIFQFAMNDPKLFKPVMVLDEFSGDQLCILQNFRLWFNDFTENSKDTLSPNPIFQQIRDTVREMQLIEYDDKDDNLSFKECVVNHMNMIQNHRLLLLLQTHSPIFVGAMEALIYVSYVSELTKRVITASQHPADDDEDDNHKKQWVVHTILELFEKEFTLKYMEKMEKYFGQPPLLHLYENYMER